MPQLLNKNNHFKQIVTNSNPVESGGHAAAQVVEALRYNPGRGSDSRWYHWHFSLTSSFRPHYGPGVETASNRNEYQEYFLGVKAVGV
jgi:hypothetical protein